MGNEWANDTQESMPFALCVGTEKQAPKSLFALHALFFWSAIPIAQWSYKTTQHYDECYVHVNG